MEPAREHDSIEIVLSRPEHLSELALIAGRHADLVPPAGACVTVGAVQSIIDRYDSLWVHHYPDEFESGQRCRTYVALRGGVAVGCVVVVWREYDPDGHIGFLVADPDAPGVAHQLLVSAVAWLRSQGCANISADSRCPIGAGWIGTPTTWTHVVDAYEQEGFVCVDDWIIMAGPLDVHPETDARDPYAPGWHVLFASDAEKREWRLEVYDGETLAAECDAWGAPPHLDDCGAFGQLVTIEWIGVEEPYLRRGIGAWLLQRQLAYQHDEGKRHVMLWTGPGNVAARRLYEQFGLSAGPETRVYGRTYP